MFSLNIQNKLILLFLEAEKSHEGDYYTEAYCI